MKDIKNTITELCKYYMEFLESDFKKNRLPSRRINFDNDDDKNIISLREYESFESKVIRYFLEKFSVNNFKIEKNQYVQRLPNDTINNIIEVVNKNSNFNNSLKAKVAKILSQHVKLNDEKINEIIEGIMKNTVNIHEYLKSIVVNDLYEEIFELWKNKQLREKDEFYLYFYEISYKDNQYPLFYIQLTVNLLDNGDYEFEFGPVLLINKKAIQYVSENYAKENELKWKVDLPARQIYIGNYKEVNDFLSLLQSTLNEITNFFEMDMINLNNDGQSISRNGVGINRKAYIALFDKSDEAILNDYEEMLNLLLSQNSSQSLEFLTKLSQEFIFENPKTFHKEVEEEYESKSLGDKLSYNNPVPLNKEQLQVIHALNINGCDRIIVHGPPGTGKSHTITAIIYDALLNKKSVLVVSDKKEALDVVEDKITEVIEKMKVDDYLQNPILRLGKTETNYNSIFTQANYDRIKNRFYAYTKNKAQIESEIKSINDKIANDIDKSINYEMSLNPKVIKWLLENEKVYKEKWADSIDCNEIIKGNMFDDFKQLYDKVNDFVNKKNEFIIKFGVNLCEFFNSAAGLNKTLRKLNESASQISSCINEGCKKYFFRNSIDQNRFQLLEDTVKEFEQMKKPVIGYLFCSSKILDLESRLSEQFINCKPFSLKRDYILIKKELQFYRMLNTANKDFKVINCDCFEFFREDKIKSFAEYTKEIIDIISSFQTLSLKLPSTVNKAGINFENLSTLDNNKLLQVDVDAIQNLIDYIKHNQKIKESGNCNLDDFLDDRKQIENGLILEMTNILDDSVINFRENYKNDAEELKKIIKQKKKIGKNLLSELINAFPCLIVNIRDLGEYIPLEANIFDIVIIDEASQVSVAQAFPAIIRGKKIVVLGDEKQFSNVKSNNASIEINNYLFNKVRDAFKKDIVSFDTDTQDMYLDKIENFSIKNSILNFIKNISNYECSLKKHFRGYLEIIGYSSKTFYGGTLEVMKIRGKSINDVIQFIKVDAGTKSEVYKNTNQEEAQYILNELRRLRDSNYKGTIGVITPFTNQQKFISNIIYNSGEWDDFKSRFKLKIMTFDSCQGDEKDIVYYSMVERDGEDLLRYIFPIDLSKINIEEDGNLKAQRLNVGLSRAKESIRFVISKDVECFKGEIGNALKHYEKLLSEPDNIELMSKTDPKSPMEKLVLNYIIQTKFYQTYKNYIEIIPQFDIGKYIKQLDPYAKIPNYRTDFLLILKVNTKEQFIIIEYDGYEYHFLEDSGYVNEFNYERMYVESDIERQKAIELYGYRFIRINKFNLGDQPIEKLNSRLEKVVKKNWTTQF